MKLPIFSYGHSILRQKCVDITDNYPHLRELIVNMWETMNNANGCGLAASQIGKPIKLFIVDSKSTFSSLEPEEQELYFEKGDTGICETFINANILNYSGNVWDEEEGCLSIPGMSQKIRRPWTITIEYLDLDFQKQIKTFGGSSARMVQHEYDHTNGILFIDHLTSLARKLLDGKLKKISKGLLPAKYPMLYIK